MRIMSTVIWKCLGFLLVASGGILVSSAQPIGPNAYCNRDVFNVTCEGDAVILIKQALYGRMRIGRCVKSNLGYLGCQKDVKGILAARCSGRQHCELAVIDDILHNTMPCDPEVTPYLEVTHECLPVRNTASFKCHHHRAIEVSARGPGAQAGYISTLLSERQGVGNSRCPWRVSVAPGQRINVTVFSFIDTTNEQLFPPIKDSCYEAGTISEKDKRPKDILACPASASSQTYKSSSHVVTIALPTRKTMPEHAAFLLKYQAVGCPDIVRADDSQVTVTGSSARVQCAHTGETRYLTCNGTSWIGRAGNCSALVPDEKPRKTFCQDKSFPYCLLLAVSIGVALGVFLGGLMLMLVALRNRRKQQTPHTAPDSESLYYESKPHHAHYCELNSLQQQALRNAQCPAHMHLQDTGLQDDMDKTHTGDYFLKPDPDLFCTIDRTRERNSNKTDKTKYGVLQQPH